MSLNENADIDTSQVSDARGGGGGMRLPGGGGLVGTLIVIALVIIGGVTGVNMIGDGDTGSDNTALGQSCATSNPDRLKNRDCRNTLYINSIQSYWTKALPEAFGKPYQPVDTVFFAHSIASGCGQADSGMGPFYCPADHLVYIDLTFYDELATRFGAKGEFAQPYVLAHEYGHHVQSLLGTDAQVRRSQQRDPGNANKLSVLLELQADCFAGVWAKHATETTDATGQPIFTAVTLTDINQALDAASSIGDDVIQKKAGGQVNESKFTHGTGAQRKAWFAKGSETGDPRQCDTFAA
jgi:predicted metalloprotease